MKTKSGIQGLRGLGPALCAVLLWFALGLLSASPAAAALRSFFADSGGTYVCGGPREGMRGVMNFGGAPACTTDAVLPVRDSTGIIATFYTPGVYSATSSRIRGNELYLDLEAGNPGEVTIQLGYGASVASFTPIGSVTVNVDWTRNAQGHRVDLSPIWGVLPANNYLALRIAKVASRFTGTLYMHNMPVVGGPTPNGIRGSVYDAAWTVGGSQADFRSMQEAISDGRVQSGDRIYVMPGTHNGTGFVNVNFGSKDVMVIGEGGPAATIIDCEYAGRAFHFNTASITNAGGIEGLTIRRARGSSVLIEGGAAPTIRNCVFRDSDSTSSNGGAIRLNATLGMTDDAEVEGCTFVGNRTSSMTSTANNGGAISVDAGSGLMARLTIKDSAFLRNTAAGNGGAIHVSADTAAVQISDSTFVENSAVAGGALHADCSGAVTVERCRFDSNYAMVAGAAASRRVAFLSSVFHRNGASGAAGAVYVTGGSDPAHTVLDFCTLTKNFALGAGGVAVVNGGFVTIVNSILWGDWHLWASPSGKEVYAPAATVKKSNSDVQGGTAAMVLPAADYRIIGGNIIDVDPLLAFDDSPHLMPGSPCIDQGNTAAPLPIGMGLTHPSFDADKIARSLTGGAAGTADLGAFEYHGDAGKPLPIASPERLLLSQRAGGPPPDPIVLSIKNASVTTLPWLVQTDAPWLVVRPPAEGEATDGTATVSVVLDSAGLAAGEYHGTISVSVNSADPPAWATDSPRIVEVLLTVNRTRTVCSTGCDYTGIQAAVNDATPGDEIVVMDGSYPGGITTRGKRLLLRSANGRDATAIDCGGLAGVRGITVPNGDYRPTVIQGLTIQNCTGANGTDGGRQGGGLWSGGLTYVVVLDSRFENNDLGPGPVGNPTEGGGMFVGWWGHVARSEFVGNDADYGGGLCMQERLEGVLTVEETTFKENVASFGGGLYVDQSDTGATVLLRNVFDSNTSGNGRASGPYGLGAYLTGNKIGVEACIFTNNGYGSPGSGYGGGLYVNSSSTAIANSLFTGNRALYGGGLYSTNGDAGIVNSTFYGNHAAQATAEGGGGIYLSGSSSSQVLNSIATGNTDGNAAANTGDDIRRYDPSAALVSYSGIGVGWSTANNNRTASAADFVNAGASDFRLAPTSGLIDTGKTVNWLFSDIRGSVRAIDGKSAVVPLGVVGGVTDARVDMGAFEYSRYYGGIGEDATAKAFRDLRINAPIVATGYEYRIQWDTKDPFPNDMDERVAQAGEYEVRLLLMGTRNNRVVLGTWKMRLGVGYTVPYTFGAEHVGTWRIRLEMVSDIGQYVESDEITIQYKKLVEYFIGKKIPPPFGALPGQKPDTDNEEAVYWSTETNELYAIAPYPVQITWYADKDRTVPILVMAMLRTPLDPVLHVADAPPVILRPEGTRFGAVGILWSESSATISSDSFTAPQDGWTTLLFRDSVNAKPELREFFTVVRTLTWNHQGVDPAWDTFYPPLPGQTPPDPLPGPPPVDPIYPLEKTWEIGLRVFDDEHQPQAACSGGHILNEVAPYDGAGDERAYDRPTRSGQIFAVNEDDPRTEEDDLVVIWYRRQGSVEEGAPGVCWPFKPVRYDPFWPAKGAVCPGPACNRIQISGKLENPVDPKSRVPNGSGALPPADYGAWDNMSIYNQPDQGLPGFNPNEEHAMLFTSEGTPFPGAFPLRSDLNNDVWNNPPFSMSNPAYTSPPAVLVKYRRPDSGEWDFRVFHVEKGDLTYYPEAGNEFNPPYPLNQFVFGPCRDILPVRDPAWDPASALSPHTGTWTDAVLYKEDGSNIATATALLDKDKKIFSIRGASAALGEEPVLVRTYQFYRLQPDFWFDRDYNGWPDRPPGTCVPLLDGLDGNENGQTPAPITYDIQWPETPTLYVGETLADAKMQAGETVGLPNVKDQCIVTKVWDEAGVRLFDPLKEFRYPDPDAPYAPPGALPVGELKDKDGTPLKTDPPTPVGSRVTFRDLPPQLQQRLTYDAVTEQLKLKGEYITTTGEPVLMLNTLSVRERKGVMDALNLAEGSAFLIAIDALRGRGNTNLAGKPSIARWEADFKALSAGTVNNTGYVTLAFNNHEDCPAPTMLSVIEVDCPLYRGDLKVVESPNPFEEKLTLRHNGDFGGKPDDRYFQWVYLQGFSGIPEGPGTDGENWLPFNKDNSAPGPTNGQTLPVPDEGTFARGLVDITPLGTGQQLLPDRWFAVRYYYGGQLNYHTDPPAAGPVCSMVSPWTPPQLAEGWVKRVMKKINLFDQRVKDFHKTDADTLASMIAQAGRAYEGDVALSDEPEYLKRVGLIELYETLLSRALKLSLDADPVDPNLRDAVLFAANRLASLYVLLGNEAYADSADPTIGFGTQDGQYGAAASSIYAFQNQMDTLLDEEFALLAGRSDEGMRPYYNRIPWNFTIADGEVAYRQVYNITDVADATGAMEPDGEINEYDAKFLFPQGHGDAWGHYLSAIKRLYYIITHDASSLWAPTVEAILVAQAPVEVDYRDERLFATVAAARARTGLDLVNLAYRRSYDEDPERQWRGYRDSNSTRAWGLAEWASRAGQGAYLDWAVGNALLPPVATTINKTETFPAPETQRVESRYVLGADYARGILEITVDNVSQAICPAEAAANCWKVALVEDPVKGWSRTQIDVLFNPLPAVAKELKFRVSLPAEGIKRVDRTTVVELHEITAQFNAIQSILDQADRGLNPLGVAKDTVPFDIDPALVATGQTHFEQIYGRALQALQNAATVFDYANQSSQMLRRQQDRLDDFKRTIDDREADFTSRLVEVFGYPYPEDCGPGKLYPTGYCESGPDLYHYMYVDASKLMGEANTDKGATTAPRELEYTVTFRDLKADDTGALTEEEVPVKFTVDEDRRFGIIKPASWTGNRRAPGALQLSRSDLLQLQGRFERAIIEYETLIEQVEDQADLVGAQYNLNSKEIQILQDAKGEQQTLNDSILNGRESAASMRASAQDAILVANLAMEAIPKVIGMATDAMSALRGIALGVGQGISLMLNQQADDATIGELSSQQAKEIAGAEANIRITTKRADFAVMQQILQLENLVRREAVLRQELYTLVEGLQQSAGRFLTTLASGERVLEERLRFRKQTAAQVQDYRYTDMTFRVFRNDALQKYKAQLDLAGRYAYLAAKAYDYETTLLDSSGMAGRAFLTGIVKERSIGTVLGGQPLAGTGLADVLRRLSLNFQVLKPQLGFNNPQVETNRFSLRRELFRVRFDEGSDETWRDVLAAHKKDDLWEVPEFRRFCRPFAAEGVPQPGLVIPFRTTVTSGLNFFGWPLGGGDSYYSAANFATKVRSVGVWFSNYNATGLAQTPRVYLVPAGEDVLRSPTGGVGDIRSWQVLDQRLPAPQLVNTAEMAGDPDWVPAVNTILDEFGAPRRHADFKAYHDSGYLEPSELTYDTRLVGRSVWNTKWMLIIPGRNLLYDPDEGLDTFIQGPEIFGGTGDRSGNGISDIKLFFTTYAYSGY